MSEDARHLIGFTFQVGSGRDPAEFAALIRRQWKAWFDKRSGARGWIVGPVTCLWHSPYWTPGPMVFALILRAERGTKVVGIAGYDLMGAIGLALVGIGVPIAIVEMGGSLLLAALIGGFALFALAWRANLHHEADPIVRFIEKVDKPPEPRKRNSKATATQRVFEQLTLTVDGMVQPGPVTAEMIADALASLAGGGFLIIAAAEETYMQVAEVGDEFIIERRDDDHRSHVRAIYADGRSGHESEAGTTFSAEVTLETLLAYAANKPLPSILAWRPL